MRVGQPSARRARAAREPRTARLRSLAMSVVDNAAESRFELEEAGETAYADYRREGGRLVIPYVYAPPALRGSGAAGRVMEGVVAAARAEGLTIRPLCGYAAAWLKRHREHADLVA